MYENRLEDRVRAIILERYKSVRQFSEVIGVPPTTIYSILNNGFEGKSVDTVLAMCKALDLDPSSLARKRIRRIDNVDPEFIDLPIVLSVSAGVPNEELPVDDLTHPVPVAMGKKYPNAKLVRVNGTSMDKVLPDGTYALVDFGGQVATGDIALVNVDGSEGLIKRVRILDRGVELIPDSTDPTYESYVYKCADEDCTNIVIRGPVVWYTPPFDYLTAF